MVILNVRTQNGQKLVFSVPPETALSDLDEPIRQALGTSGVRYRYTLEHSMLHRDSRICDLGLSNPAACLFVIPIDSGSARERKFVPARSVDYEKQFMANDRSGEFEQAMMVPSISDPTVQQALAQIVREPQSLRTWLRDPLVGPILDQLVQIVGRPSASPLEDSTPDSELLRDLDDMQ
jgi:hypothetical protein